MTDTRPAYGCSSATYASPVLISTRSEISQFVGEIESENILQVIVPNTGKHSH